jgi:hypothetical protein
MGVCRCSSCRMLLRRSLPKTQTAIWFNFTLLLTHNSGAHARGGGGGGVARLCGALQEWQVTLHYIYIIHIPLVVYTE